MAWKQLRDASMKVGYIGGWCLKYVQDAYGTDHPYPTAIAAWNAEPNKHYDVPPLGITVPVYLSLGNEPAGHVAIRLDDGYVASSTLGGSHGGPYLHKSLDDLVAVYAKYNGGAKYLGWGEHVGTQHVVEWAKDTATDDQIRQAYSEILERTADEGGLAHYRAYSIDFVIDDLLKSSERRDLIAAKAARDAEAAAAAEAKAKAEAEAKAREDAVAAQPEPVPVVTENHNNTPAPGEEVPNPVIEPKPTAPEVVTPPQEPAPEPAPVTEENHIVKKALAYLKAHAPIAVMVVLVVLNALIDANLVSLPQNLVDTVNVILVALGLGTIHVRQRRG